jgi:hypothetical protein
MAISLSATHAILACQRDKINRTALGHYGLMAPVARSDSRQSSSCCSCSDQTLLPSGAPRPPAPGARGGGVGGGGRGRGRAGAARARGGARRGGGPPPPAPHPPPGPGGARGGRAGGHRQVCGDRAVSAIGRFRAVLSSGSPRSRADRGSRGRCTAPRAAPVGRCASAPGCVLTSRPFARR